MLDIADFNSDHPAVILNIVAPAQPLPSDRHTFMNYKKANWRTIRNHVEESVESLVQHNCNMTVPEKDTAITNINKLRQDAATTAVTTKQAGLIELPPDLVKIIEYQNKL